MQRRFEVAQSERRVSPQDTPFTQRLYLSWVVIKDVCLGRTHKPASVMTNKTNTLLNERRSYLNPCANNIHVKEKLSANQLSCTTQNHRDACQGVQTDSFSDTVFDRKETMKALLLEVERFVTIMQGEMYQHESNSWVTPLPLTPRQRLPNN